MPDTPNMSMRRRTRSTKKEQNGAHAQNTNGSASNGVRRVRAASRSSSRPRTSRARSQSSTRHSARKRTTLTLDTTDKDENHTQTQVESNGTISPIDSSPSPSPSPVPSSSPPSPSSLLSRTTVSAHHALRQVKHSCTRYQLLAFEHCPDWLRDNRYIRSGYRANIGWRHSVESVCHLHNETVNVWTHLIAFLTMTCILILTMSLLSPHGADRIGLDVVLTSQPTCEMMSATAGVGSVPSYCASITPGGGPHGSSESDDPLDVLHRILGDNQDEMLVELVSRVQNQVPKLQELTSALRAKATEVQDSLLAAARKHVPEDTTRNLLKFKEDTGRSFAEYVEKTEKRLSELAETLSSFCINCLSPITSDEEEDEPEQSSETAGVNGTKKNKSSSSSSSSSTSSSSKLHAEYIKVRDHLKQILSDFGRDFSPDLLHPSNQHLDLIKVTRQMIENFMEENHLTKKGLRLSPELVARPDVQVRVANMIADGSGSVAGLRAGLSLASLGLDEAFEEMGATTQKQTTKSATLTTTHASTSPSTELDEMDSIGRATALLDKHARPKTTVDADGQGKTASTSIGYMTVEARTRTSEPGRVQLQLHSFLPRHPLAVFILTAMACLAFSSIYHLLHAVSEEWAVRFQSLDYAGIVLLIAGSSHPVIYYSFFCVPVLKWTYISVMWALGCVVFIVVIWPDLRGPKYRILKTVCFIAMGFSGCVPLIHFQYLLGSMHFMTYWLLVMGACYLTGAAIYVLQIPERWWPGYFDYFAASHQLWHVSIIAAVIVHYCGLMHLYEWRMTRVCGPGMYA